MVSSKPRRGQDASTRELLVDACRRVLESGRGPLSMASVAMAAGVSRQAVYLHFSNRAELLAALVDEVNVPMQDGLRTVERSGDGRAALRAFVDVVVFQTRRHGALLRAVRDAIAGDPALARTWSRRRSGRRAGAARVARLLQDEGRLHPSLDAAAAREVLLAMTGPDIVEGLLHATGDEVATETLMRGIGSALTGPGGSRHP